MTRNLYVIRRDGEHWSNLSLALLSEIIWEPTHVYWKRVKAEDANTLWYGYRSRRDPDLGVDYLSFCGYGKDKSLDEHTQINRRKDQLIREYTQRTGSVTFRKRGAK